MKSTSDFQILKYILITFLGWRIILTFIAFFGLSVFPQTIAPGQIEWANSGIDFWIKWANWDGGHFRGIAESGYLPFQVVFFPLYPLLIKALIILKIPSLWGGLLISNLSIIGALFYLYKTVILDFEESVAKKTIFIALAFPTAFYFTAVYSESLFLFLTIAAFHYARKHNWLIALLFASLSAVTRLTGLVVILAVTLEYFLKTTRLPTVKEFRSEFLNRIAFYLLLLAFFLSVLHKAFLNGPWYLFTGLSNPVTVLLTLLALLLLSLFATKFLIKNFDFKKLLTRPSLFLFLSFLPFLGYCLFLYFAQSNFLAFVSHEEHWERYLTLPWSAPINYFVDLAVGGFFKVGHSAQGLIELLFFIFFLIMFIISYFKLRLSYTMYFALSLLMPTTTGTLQAIHRYGLVIFPVFILLALIKNETYYQLWLFFSLTLLGILTVLFINSYWVS